MTEQAAVMFEGRGYLAKMYESPLYVIMCAYRGKFECMERFFAEDLPPGKRERCFHDWHVMANRGMVEREAELARDHATPVGPS